MNLKIQEIIDVSANQTLLDNFCDSVGIAAAIIDLEGTIVIGSRWQSICTDFHRKNPRSNQKCVESDTTIANRLNDGEKFSLYQCRNGLYDAASPIIVQNRHIANAFVGQFLIAPPDIAYFKDQATTYGFDETSYLQALAEVPVIEETEVRKIVSFLVSYAEMLAGMAVNHQKQLFSERQLIEAEQEIVAQQRTAEIIEKERKRLLSLMDGIDDVIYVSDPESYELLHVNEAFKSNWGGDINGKKCYKVLQNRDAPCPFCTNDRIFGDMLGQSHVWEFQNEVNQHWYRCSDKAIQWVDGRMVRFEIAADITSLKLLEDELKQKNDELGRSNKELEQFAYVASHDLQEPLRMVASYTELLQERYQGKLDAKADKYIGYAVDGAKRMQGLINDLLLLSRVNTRGKPFGPVDCNDLVQKVLQSMRAAIEDQQARIEVGPLPVILGDETQLFQLFQNLIANAVKFHGADLPVVKISAKQNNSTWIFQVQDNGIGIDSRFFDRIFIIFQRLHERGAYQGTGIGLAISKKIVERHGGNIWIESQPDKGSSFYFSLPKEMKNEELKIEN